MLGADGGRARQALLQGAQDLDALDRVDPEVGVEAHAGLEHRRGVAGLLRDHFQQHALGFNPARGRRLGRRSRRRHRGWRGLLGARGDPLGRRLGRQLGRRHSDGHRDGSRRQRGGRDLLGADELRDGALRQRLRLQELLVQPRGLLLHRRDGGEGLAGQVGREGRGTRGGGVGHRARQFGRKGTRVRRGTRHTGGARRARRPGGRRVRPADRHRVGVARPRRGPAAPARLPGTQGDGVAERRQAGQQEREP